jgi:3',5'-cyclic AMP phosphodiesterase CpdA
MRDRAIASCFILLALGLGTLLGCGGDAPEESVAATAPSTASAPVPAADPVQPEAQPAGMQTPQNPPAEMAFLVYGDTRSFPDVHRACVEQLAQHTDAAFVCHTGDMIGDGSQWALWEQFLEITEPLRHRMPFCPAIGNHDLPRSNAVRAMAQMQGIPPDVSEDATYYGFDAGDVRIAMLDSESLVMGDQRQYDWARQFLSERPQSFKIVMLHRPLWSPGPNGSCVPIREKLLPILQETGVRLVFTGHDHMYYRTYRDGVTQVITGGGGAPLYDPENTGMMIEGDVTAKVHHYCRVDVRADAIIVTTLDLEGEIIDQFHLLTGR